MTEIKKRFIAGAVCPRCAKMDKTVMYKKDGVDIRECISCGFSDEMHFKPVQREIATRVNVTEEEKQSQVQILDFPPKK